MEKHVAEKFMTKWKLLNPNTTWKDTINTDCQTGEQTRHNNAQKIQHTFRRWQFKYRVEAYTQLLSSPGILDNLLPMELYDHIVRDMSEDLVF